MGNNNGNKDMFKQTRFRSIFHPTQHHTSDHEEYRDGKKESPADSNAQRHIEDGIMGVAANPDGRFNATPRVVVNGNQGTFP